MRAGSVIMLGACGSGPAPPAAPWVGKALVAVLAAADHARAPWRCVTPDLPVLADERLGKWQLAGHAVSRVDAGAEIVIGVVADAGGAAPATVAALARLRTQLAAADLVVTLGGMGATESELEATLGTLADHAPWPVVALPGDLEPTSAHRAAIAVLRQRGDLVIDGRLARWIELPGVTIGSVPGAGAAGRLVAGDDGCAWQPEAVAALYAELAARPGLRIAATAEAPRAGESGELALVPTVAVDVVLHGPTRSAPTPALAGGRDGAHIALSPGTADATTRLPDSHASSVGLLVIRGTTWRWKPLVDTRR